MGKLDTVIRGGQVATASDTVACDVGIREGRIVALGDDLGTADEIIDARGKLVLPGGHRQPCAFRPAERPRHRHGGRLRERHPRGRLRRQHAGHAVLPAAERREPAPGGQGLPRQGGRQVPHGRQLPPHHLRPDPAGAGPGAARARRRRLHLLQGLHDLRGPRPVGHASCSRCSRSRARPARW